MSITSFLSDTIRVVCIRVQRNLKRLCQYGESTHEVQTKCRQERNGEEKIELNAQQSGIGTVFLQHLQVVMRLALGVLSSLRLIAVGHAHF